MNDMELRILNYFLVVAREENILKASKSLHISQPTLSRQLKDLEKELGKTLFIRGNRKITLTEEGMLFKKRAEEIMTLVKKTEEEIALQNANIAGDIYIGAGETNAIRILAKTIKAINSQWPLLKFHIISGDSKDVLEHLDKGLIDFGVLFDPIDCSKYDYIRLKELDRWGVLLKKDDPLANKDSISAEELWDKPLIMSRQQKDGGLLSIWFKKQLTELNIVSTYNLIFNGSLLVEEGLGYALCLDNIIKLNSDSSICFKPLNPNLQIGISLIWKKYQPLSNSSKIFVNTLKQILNDKK